MTARQNQISRDKFIPLILDQLKPLEPHKIILFGSYAYGQANVDSDIDLLVVTNSEQMPANYREKSEIYLEISRKLREIQKQVPIDLIVHTKAMHQRFIELDSLFAQEITQKGNVLYEADDYQRSAWTKVT